MLVPWRVNAIDFRRLPFLIITFVFQLYGSNFGVMEEQDVVHTFWRRHETSPQSSQLTALKGLCLRTGAVAKAFFFRSFFLNFISKTLLPHRYES